ncbi:unnamed protein product [Medioppia subpectinata]|uniref:Cyclin-like domain-containing protein n=1 Tax=Medioppia subpectinata TaxID=1979941 RepID=A0A7R9KI10_9ACAR|nr:unnamed protein product [Medioppia subpectinata]CAG2103812.1 unnamed protein product [Medioppia subpectinata]
MDEGGEWRTFGDSNKADPSRVGSANNPFLESEQLDTMISSSGGSNAYTLKGSIGACLYIACKLENCPRTFKEISVITSVQKREIGRCYKIISKEIDSKGIMATGDIVARFCSDLNLDLKIQRVAATVSRNTQENGCLTGRSPDSIAAAIIYLVLYLFPESKDAQKDIQHITNVTEVTIKNTYKDLVAHKNEIIPNDLVEPSLIANLPKT